MSEIILFFFSDFFLQSAFCSIIFSFYALCNVGVSVAADLLKWLESLSLFGARFGPNAKCDAADRETTLD